MKGYVMDIQPFSVNDGEGIRTTIFLAGCPLRCRWCSNPEGFEHRSLVGWHVRKCIGCGECSRVCPERIGIDLNKERYNEDGSARCTACGKCVRACPVGSRVFMVREMDDSEVIEKIQKHRLFYMQSGGGITFSGGEATSQPEFIDCLSEQIYDLGYDMAIETSGMFEFDKLSNVLERMDMIFMDLKTFDDDTHRRFTGVSNKRILENISRLGSLKREDGKAPDIVIRIPVIKGVNDDEGNISDSARFVHEKLPAARMELLPYHEFGRTKYEALGIPYDGEGFARPSNAEMERLKSIVESEGVKVADFR